MRILAIDSSSLVASVAVVTDDILTAEYTINFKKTHSQTLLPMIDEISKMIELDMETIDAIAITGGQLMLWHIIFIPAIILFVRLWMQDVNRYTLEYITLNRHI